MKDTDNDRHKVLSDTEESILMICPYTPQNPKRKLHDQRRSYMKSFIHHCSLIPLSMCNVWSSRELFLYCSILFRVLVERPRATQASELSVTA